MCSLVSRPMNIATFLRKNGETTKRVVHFPRERETFRNKIMEIVEDFEEQSYNNNGKPWKSSKILRVNPFFHFSFVFHHFFSIFVFFHIFIFFFHFSSIFHSFQFFIYFLCLFSVFFHFISFSFIFPHCLSFSFIFFHFLAFSFILFFFVACSKSDFFVPQFRYDFS